MSSDKFSNPVMDPATVASLIKQNEELAGKLNTALDRISGLETATASQGHMTRQISDDMVRRIPKEQILAFLNAVQPATMFFSLPSHEGEGNGAFRRVCLICDRSEENKDARRRITTPALWMEFQPWTGPGSEIRHHETKRLWKYGWIDLAKNPLITIREQDYKAHQLNKKENPIRRGKYTIDEALTALRLTKVWAQHKVIPATLFQSMMQARYEGLWEQLKRDDEIRKQIARLDNPDQVKSGQIELAVS